MPPLSCGAQLPLLFLNYEWKWLWRFMHDSNPTQFLNERMSCEAAMQERLWRMRVRQFRFAQLPDTLAVRGGGKEQWRKEGRTSVLHKYHISGAPSHFLRMTDDGSQHASSSPSSNPSLVFTSKDLLENVTRYLIFFLQITKVVNEFPHAACNALNSVSRSN